MKIHSFVLSGLALGGAALLIVPVEESHAFSKIGGELLIGQRDFRVFNNFADATSNNAVTPQEMFPGWVGADRAIWKGHIEWGSGPHGDGSGDLVFGNPNLGDGLADFDAAWMGAATGIGNTNNNIVSALADCGGGGTLAFTETPINDGWRIRFCDEWDWDDEPGAINNFDFDIQSTAAHEYGHALGLGHSGTNAATMAPSISQGGEGPRSIHADDIAGLQCIYNPKSASKPEILATQADGTTLTIYGANFDPTDNNVWFTNANATATGADPRVRVLGVASSTNDTLITVAIPANAGPGDVLVQKVGSSSGDHLSNAWPFEANTDFVSDCVANVDCPAELVGDPTLADNAGDPNIGPKLGDAVEHFNMSLDCSGSGTGGVYSITLKANKLVTPVNLGIGDLWGNGPKYFKCGGTHTLNTVECGVIVVPQDISLLGIEYTTQGFCNGSNARLSNAIVQTVGL